MAQWSRVRVRASLSLRAPCCRERERPDRDIAPAAPLTPKEHSPVDLSLRERPFRPKARLLAYMTYTCVDHREPRRPAIQARVRAWRACARSHGDPIYFDPLCFDPMCRFSAGARAATR